MSILEWDKKGTHLYRLGCDQGVLYRKKNKQWTNGVPWNGLTAVTESPSGADEQKFYADNVLYGSIRGSEDFGGTIECYTYPDEFQPCLGEISLADGAYGNQQTHVPFSFSFRSQIGNDEDGIDHGYELHLIYNATVSPSEEQFGTINDSPEPSTMSFEFSCSPLENSFCRPLSHIVLNSTKINSYVLQIIEQMIYGTETTPARLPSPDQILTWVSETVPLMYDQNTFIETEQKKRLFVKSQGRKRG